MDIRRQCTEWHPRWASYPESIVNKAPGVFHEGLSCTRLERMHNLCCGRNFTTNENQTFKYWKYTAWTTHRAGGWSLLRQKTSNISHMVKTALM
jgi:hypothetical protein